MGGSSDATRVKADPNLLLRTVKALDIEGSDKANSDKSTWWFLLYSELWKWWWRRYHIRFSFKSSAYNTLIQQLPNKLSAMHYSKS